MMICCSTSPHFSQHKPDRAWCVQFREIPALISGMPRPLLTPGIQRLCHPGLPAHAPAPPPPLLAKFSDLLESIINLSELQDTSDDLLSTQFTEVLAMPPLRVFENIGELFIFMESFLVEEYLAASPTSTDIMTDMTVMRTWLRDLEASASTVHHKLLCFDLAALRQRVLEVASSAVHAFLRLVRETMYDKSIELQVCTLLFIGMDPVMWFLFGCFATVRTRNCLLKLAPEAEHGLHLQGCPTANIQPFFGAANLIGRSVQCRVSSWRFCPEHMRRSTRLSCWPSVHGLTSSATILLAQRLPRPQ